MANPYHTACQFSGQGEFGFLIEKANNAVPSGGMNALTADTAACPSPLTALRSAGKAEFATTTKTQVKDVRRARVVNTNTVAMNAHFATEFASDTTLTKGVAANPSAYIIRPKQFMYCVADI